MTTLYGIKNCDTIKKARKWLDNHGVDYHFHDYRKDGLELEWLIQLESKLGWQALLNKRGTTFRSLSEAQKASLDQDTALALLITHPAMIKRPLLLHSGNHCLGFTDQQYAEIFK